jgi:hypothetical protein
LFQHLAKLICTLVLCASLGTQGHSAGIVLPDEDELARAAVVAQMPDESPAERINQLLAARRLSHTERFVLASTHPGVVEQLMHPVQRLATDYLFSLTGVELYKVREGRTLIRPERSLSRKELVALRAICEHFGHDIKKLRGIRFGPRDGRVYELEISLQIKRKKTITQTMELVWPATPTRDEESRYKLTKIFGARPSRLGQGIGSLLPLVDGSFEGKLTDGWVVVRGTDFGHHNPGQEIHLDTKVAIDGRQSVRFYATDKTRQFYRVQQRVPVDPNTNVRLRAQLRTDLIRLEYQQRRSDFYLGMSFLDINGQPLGQTFTKAGRMGSHPWELLEIMAATPPGATDVEISLSSGVSGTAWYDGVILEVVE